MPGMNTIAPIAHIIINGILVYAESLFSQNVSSSSQVVWGTMSLGNHSSSKQE